MPIPTGIFSTNNGNPPELNARSFAGQILRRFPNGSAPMFALSSMAGKSRAKASTHGYFSKTMTFVRVTTGAQLDSDTTFTAVSTTVGMVSGMVLFNPRTRENIRVQSVPSGVSLTVQRAFGRIAAAAINAGDTLLLIGSAFEEGSNRPTARRLATVYAANYTQIFRNAWALTDTARASMQELGYSNVAEDRKDCAMFHAVDIECAIIWGQPKMDTTGVTPIHATQGVIDAMEQYAPGNTNVAGATTTHAQLVSFLEPAFAYSTDMSNAKERVVFCDNTAMRVFNEIGRLSGQVTMNNSETKFGMRFSQFQFYLGTVNLITHPLFNGLARTGMALVMDMPALKLAYLEGRDTKPEEYGFGGKSADNGIDAVGGSLTTELAVELVNPYACTYIEGLTAGAA